MDDGRIDSLDVQAGRLTQTAQPGEPNADWELSDEELDRPGRGGTYCCCGKCSASTLAEVDQLDPH